MKQNILFGLLAVLSIVLSACHDNSGDEPTQPEYTNEVTFSAGINRSSLLGVSHRVHLGEDRTGSAGGGTAVLWSTDDNILCWSSTAYANYRLIRGADTQDGTFQGKAVTAADNSLPQFSEPTGTELAIYPASAAYLEGSKLMHPGNLYTSIYFTMPNSQEYEAPINGQPTYKGEYGIMTGRWVTSKGAGNYMSFQNACGALLLKIKGSAVINNIKKLKLHTTSDNLYGKFSAAIAAYGIPTITYVNGGSNELILDCTNGGTGVSLGAGTAGDPYKEVYFYFVLPPGVLKSGFTVLIETGNDDGFDNGTITTSRDNSIERGLITIMPTLELTENVNLSWSLDDLYKQGTVTEM